MFCNCDGVGGEWTSLSRTINEDLNTIVDIPLKMIKVVGGGGSWLLGKVPGHWKVVNPLSYSISTQRDFYPGRMRDAGQGMNSSRSCLVSQTFQTSSMFQTQLSGRQLKTFSAPWFWIVLDDVSIVYSFAG